MLLERKRLRPDKWESCQKKQGYDTAQEARRVAEAARNKSGDRDILEYPCEYCDKFHVGHYTL